MPHSADSTQQDAWRSPLVQRLRSLFQRKDRGALAQLRRAAYDPFDNTRIYMVIGNALPEDVSETEPHLLTAVLFSIYVQPFVDRSTDKEEETEKEEDEDFLLGREAFDRRSFPNRSWDSFGASMRLLREKIEEDPERSGEESLETHFTALLDAQFEDLPQRLRRLVHRLRGDEIPLYFPTLLKDLRQWKRQENTWTRPNDTVQSKWARDYWQPPSGDGS